MKSPRPLRAVLLHALRVLLVVSTAAAIHVGHARRSANADFVGLTELPNEVWQPLFVMPLPIAGQRVPDDGRVRILGSDLETVGYLLQTSPAGDEAIGFSGPSNVLIALDDAGRITGVRIANSGDTVEHVEAVNRSMAFRNAWDGLTLREASAHQVDAVSGATLTSTAANRAIMLRCGGELESLRFPEPITLEHVQRIFPEATEIHPLLAEEQTEVVGANGLLGYIIRPSRQGIPTWDKDNPPTWFQGPTDVLIGLDTDLNIAGLAFLKSFENEPYYGYVLDDRWFPKSLNGQSFPSFHEVDLFEARVEGVSGATMTSMTIIEMVQQASEKFDGIREGKQTSPACDLAVLEFWLTDRLKLLRQSLGTIALVVIGCFIAFRPGRRRYATIWPIVVLIGLGFWRGDLLSQAMFVGWAKHGVSTVGGYGLVALAAVAFFFPVAAGRNVYCSHLCAHGAAQMLVRNRLPRRWRLPRWSVRPLNYLPAVLLAAVVAIAAGGFTLSLVNLEAFDAYLWPVCGWIPLVIAISGLIVSLIEPMAYCRFACPTGSLLDYIRRHRRSDHWTRVDWFAAILVAISWGLAIT